ncbi:2602_t:CDS:2, partial [Racocetra persica]
EIREEVCVEVQDLGEDSEFDREEEDKEAVDYENERICEQLLTISLISSGTLTNAAKGT